MDQNTINAKLAEGNSQMENIILQEVKNYVKISGERMAEYWPIWEQNERIYRGYRITDKDDKEAMNRREPGKIIIPVSYAQTQSYLSFIMAIIGQRERFFELVGRGPEDQRYKEGLELDLQYQLERAQYYLKFYSWILNSCIYGFGAVRPSWEVEKRRVRTYQVQGAVESPMSELNEQFGLGPIPRQQVVEQVVEGILYEGNTLEVISPYSIFPDPDLPLRRFQEGSFFATEQEKSRVWVRRHEGTMFFGSDKIPESIAADLWAGRNRYVGKSWEHNRKSLHGIGNIETTLLTDVIFHLTPSELSKKSGVNFGKGKTPEKWIATVANDQKILRLQPYGYLHDKYNCAVIEYSPQEDEFVSPGLSTTIDKLQEIANWFLNSHVANVRKVIKNQFIGSEERVHTADIENGKTFIRIKGAVIDPSRVLKQLDVTDVTQNHVNDMEIINKIIQLVTGISDNALGQYSSGRRSAYEARQVNAGIGSRMKMHANLAFFQGFEVLGRLMVANTQQGRSQEIYEQILGEGIEKYPYDQVILTPPSRIMGGYDFAPLDTTLPSDRHAQAEIFKELLANPELMVAAQKDPKKVVDHLLELFNIRNISDFDVVQQPQAEVVPDNVALEQGGAPVDAFGTDLLSQLSQAV